MALSDSQTLNRSSMFIVWWFIAYVIWAAVLKWLGVPDARMTWE